MESRADLFGHPIHALLVNFPVALIPTAFLFDLIFLRRGDPFWRRAAFWLLVVGEAGALAAAVPGLIDYFSIAMPAAARQVARVHLILGLSVVVLTGLQLWLRRGDAGASPTAPKAGIPALGFLCALGVLTQGALGGHLSHVDRVGVVPAPAEALSPEAQNAALLAQGEPLFGIYCVECHGEKGTGNNGPRLAGSGLPLAEIRETVTNGRPPAMPPFKETLQPEQVAAVAAYARFLAASRK
jgi:uncharacterized membrane protein